MRGAAHKAAVLVVEDETFVRTYMRDLLEDVGFHVHEAVDADGALEKLEGEEFDAVVSDIEMPGEKSGLDLAWIVDRKWPSTGLVLVSGRHLPSPAGMPAKARFIAKPCLQTVREVIT
jgi:CheY-like chemotaxis protein